MATRYLVTWLGATGELKWRGFAFQGGALDLWRVLIESEYVGAGGCSCASVAYLGANGERFPEDEKVSSTFSKVAGEAVGVEPPKSNPEFDRQGGRFLTGGTVSLGGHPAAQLPLLGGR